MLGKKKREGQQAGEDKQGAFANIAIADSNIAGRGNGGPGRA